MHFLFLVSPLNACDVEVNDQSFVALSDFHGYDYPIDKINNYYLNEYNKCIGVISYVILGVNVGRGDQRMYVFEWNDFMGELYKNRLYFRKY